MKASDVLPTIAVLTASAAVFFAAPASAATVSRECRVDNVAVFSNRIHVKCLPIAGVANTLDIRYFALPITEEAARIQSIIALAIEAKRSNSTLTIWYDVDDYAGVSGCQGSDCRRLQGVALE